MGVRPAGPGFSSFTVRPQTEAPQWAEGTIPTPHGPISVTWRKGRPTAAFNLSFNVPEGTLTLVSIPVLAGLRGGVPRIVESEQRL
ncbi:MAG: alpha-L-rhamnosidase C-terminal domain-containing protein [Terriglobia bacterium]